MNVASATPTTASRWRRPPKARSARWATRCSACANWPCRPATPPTAPPTTRPRWTRNTSSWPRKSSACSAAPPSTAKHPGAATPATQTFQVGANTTANDIDHVTTNMTRTSSVNTDITAVTGGNLTGRRHRLATVIDNIDTALDTSTASAPPTVRCRTASKRDRHPAWSHREPGRRAQPHHGRRLRRRNGQPESRARSCSRPATRWWPRPTSCRSRCWPCCAEPRLPVRPAGRAGRPSRARPPPGGFLLSASKAGVFRLYPANTPAAAP
jgi:hypothetical protein